MYAAQRRFAAAWASGDADAIQMTGGELRLLMPKHRDIGGVNFVLAVLSSSVPDTEIPALANRLPSDALRDKILHTCMKLAPSRKQTIIKLLPAEKKP
jgi:hypothetical protein